MPEGILTLRWAEFKDGEPNANFGVRSRLVTQAELSGLLPAGCREVVPQEREHQLGERARSYAWRLAQECEQ
jgi:hypothetical protein